MSKLSNTQETVNPVNPNPPETISGVVSGVVSGVISFDEIQHSGLSSYFGGYQHPCSRFAGVVCCECADEMFIDRTASESCSSGSCGRSLWYFVCCPCYCATSVYHIGYTFSGCCCFCCCTKSCEESEKAGLLARDYGVMCCVPCCTPKPKFQQMNDSIGDGLCPLECIPTRCQCCWNTYMKNWV